MSSFAIATSVFCATSTTFRLTSSPDSSVTPEVLRMSRPYCSKAHLECPLERFILIHRSLEVHSWFLLHKRNRTEMALIRISCECSLEAILGPRLGKACGHRPYHHTSTGAFCHPRYQIRLRQRHSSAYQAFYYLNL